MKQRKRTRVESRKWVTLAWPKGNSRGDLVNLSLKGCLLENMEAHSLEVGQEVAVTIHLELQAPELDVRVKGRIVRADQSTVAVDFSEVELESFRHLFGLVQYNAPEPEAIGQELSIPAFIPPPSSGKKSEK
jgi:hypothetical protein